MFFYYHNVPAIAVNETVHLQHSEHANPFAMVDLEFSAYKLALSQPYDVVVELEALDSPTNHAIGNFMVQLDMLSDAESIISSSRPTILKYKSPLIDTMSTVLMSAPLLFGMKSESQVLRVSVLEGYSFEAGWLTSPSQAKIEIHAPSIELYSCKIMFQTRLEGLTWILFNFKITSFVVFTTLFWVSSMAFMVLSWALVMFVIFPSNSKTVKSEESAPPTRSTSPDIKSESGSTTSFPRMPVSAKARSKAPSSIYTESFFEFDAAKSRSSGTDATSLMDEDQYIKQESESE